MKLIFTGDINFRGHDGITAEESRAVLADVRPYLDAADFRIANVETVLADVNRHKPIIKSGPNHIGKRENLAFLRELRADATTLANNHIGDFGPDAAMETIALLQGAGIKTVGAGTDINDAYRAVRFEKDGVSAAILNVCENEFGMATASEAGSAGYKQLLLCQRIREEKKTTDFVIVVFHGGNEFNPMPSPATAERYRMLIEMGADAVIGGHPHCPQGTEEYNGKPIAYSVGNFFLQKNNVPQNNSWHCGYLCTLTLTRGKAPMLEVTPYRMDAKSGFIKVFYGAERGKIDGYLAEISEPLRDDALLANYFKGWASDHVWVEKLPDVPYSEMAWKIAPAYDLWRCEAHNTQSIEALRLIQYDLMESARPWAQKLRELQTLPV